MRLSHTDRFGISHHVIRLWNYAAQLHGSIACDADWSFLMSEESLREKPPTCLHCAISRHGGKDTVFRNEDA